MVDDGEMGCARGRGRSRDGPVSMPSSSSSSSSSEFEFSVSLSPTSKRSSAQLCPADELFYKGQLLPLHLSPRLSMVRTLLLASSSTSSDSTATTASRDSNGSSSSSAASDLLLLLPDCDSSRPSSVTEDDACRLYSSAAAAPRRPAGTGVAGTKYFSSFANRFSSIFLHRGSKKDASAPSAKKANSAGASSSSSAKEVIKKYVRKVRPIYEKLSSLQSKHIHQEETGNRNRQKKTFSFSIRREREVSGSCIIPAAPSFIKREDSNAGAEIYSHSHSHSFSGNLRYPRGKRYAGSCPSSVRSSPSHSGLLAMGNGILDPATPSSCSSSSSSMEELQSAIQGAIAHCKSSMIQANHNKAPAPLSDCRNSGS